MGTFAIPTIYWEGIPWQARVFVIIVFIVFTSPVWLQFIRGKLNNTLTKEKIFDVRRDEFDKQMAADAKASREILESERKAWSAERTVWFKRERELMDDRLNGWDRGRGMEVLAHRLWHDMNNLTMAFNKLRELMLRLLAGSLSKEVAIELLKEAPERSAPGKVPPLAMIDPVTPHDTKYHNTHEG